MEEIIRSIYIENSTLSVLPAVQKNVQTTLALREAAIVHAIIQTKVSLNIILNIYLHNHVINMLGAPVAYSK